MVDVICRLAADRDRWRWRCSLCTGFGFAADEDSATDDFERHYAAAHRPRESA